MDIKAFKAWRYNRDEVGDAAACVSPPYDVIDSRIQELLYNKNRSNVVRIIKGKDSDPQFPGMDKYQAAAEYLKSWVESGVLQEDDKPAIYAYVQSFDIDGQNYRRDGFIALGKLSEFGGNVKPHEKTLDGPKADRLKLMTATAAQFGQIFMLYDDTQKVADAIIDKACGGGALLSFTDSDSVEHSLYAIDDPADINAISEMMADKDAVIADGHHRYETALNYYRQSGNAAAEYRMMTFVNMRNPGLVILPTHRLVGNVKDFNAAKLIEGLSNDFEIDKFVFASFGEKQSSTAKMFEKMNEQFLAGKNTFGLYQNDSAFYCITLKNQDVVDGVSVGLSEASRKLDVTVLHKVILEKILDIDDKALAAESNVEYLKDIGDAKERAIESVDSGDKQAVFFMNPTRIEQVRAVAAEGEKMPQKSTFFHPKIFTGLTINILK